MVRIELDRESAESGAAGRSYLLRMEGHSGFGVKGGDVVCAAISAVTQTAIVGITQVAGIAQDLSEGDGFLETRIDLQRLGDSQKASLNIIIETMLAGLREIEKTYPGSLSISIR